MQTRLDGAFRKLGDFADLFVAQFLDVAKHDENPVIFLESAALYGMKGEVPDDPDATEPFGVSTTKRVHRSGRVRAFLTPSTRSCLLGRIRKLLFYMVNRLKG